MWCGDSNTHMNTTKTDLKFELELPVDGVVAWRGSAPVESTMRTPADMADALV